MLLVVSPTPPLPKHNGQTSTVKFILLQRIYKRHLWHLRSFHYFTLHSTRQCEATLTLGCTVLASLRIVCNRNNPPLHKLVRHSYNHWTFPQCQNSLSGAVVSGQPHMPKIGPEYKHGLGEAEAVVRHSNCATVSVLSIRIRYYR